MIPNSRILVILGPTASGKSALAVKLAKKYNGEIISADSRQVYKGLDIGTGKIAKKEMRGVPHHLLDIANPKRRFTVVEYQELARQKISEILSRGHLPILCGGTGFYISAVIDDVSFPDVPPNQKLRQNLSIKSSEFLFAKLQKLDPARAKNIDPKNSRRLIRAIEIATALGKVPKITPKPLYNALQIGTLIKPTILREKINSRLISRFKQGMLAEVRKLHRAGLSWKRMEELGLEYRYLALFLQKKITEPEMIGKLQTEIWRYARRQMTWFRKNTRIKWILPTNDKKIEAQIDKFLRA